MLAPAQLALLLAPSTTEASELLLELAELGWSGGQYGRVECWVYCMGWRAANCLWELEGHHKEREDKKKYIFFLFRHSLLV